MASMLDARGSGTARGIVVVHSCPRAVAPHLAWALAKVLGTQSALEWSEQTVAPGMLRSSLAWSGRPGTGARLASALVAFTSVRFEVTEDPSAGREGERFAATPSLGLHRATIGVHGDIVVTEDRLRALLTGTDHHERLADAVRGVLGQAWDDELEPYRSAGADGIVRVLTPAI